MSTTTTQNATLEFVEPLLNPTAVLNLLIAAGMYIGIGDGRPEKGKLSYGRFEVMSTVQAQADPVVQQIFSEAREIQTAAMENPEPYNDEARELLTWFEAEIKTRGKKLAAA